MKRTLLSLVVAAAIVFAPVQSQAADKLTVLLEWFVNPDHAPMVIAKERGLFADAGLDVELVPPADPSAVPRLVSAKQADIGVHYQPNLYLDHDAGLPLVRFGTLVETPLNTVTVLAEGPIKSLKDLKGKKVGVGKGTSAHNLLVAAIEKNGLKFSDIDVVYLSPADAAAAFASDKIDAWAVWDPFYAIAETRYKPVTLARTSEVLNVSTYFLANRDYAKSHADTINITLDAQGEAAKWSAANRDKVAAALHEVTGVPLEAQTLAANRSEFGISKIDDKIIASQQETADRFYRLGLIPKQISIKDAVWSGATN